MSHLEIYQIIDEFRGHLPSFHYPSIFIQFPILLINFEKNYFSQKQGVTFEIFLEFEFSKVHGQFNEREKERIERISNWFEQMDL